MATKRRAGGALQRDLEQVQWRSIFSRNAIKSYINSVQFMRKLTVIALSTITHVRNILPSECFKTHLFGGLHLKIIQEKTSTEKSNFIASSLQAALEAFDKRYLHQIALCLYEDESKPETLLESYIFTFNYTENSASVSLESNSQNTHSSFDDIKMSTKQLLNNITAMSQELKRDLPPDYDMTFHLYYYEDVTPVGYNPPGFEHVSGEQDPLEPYTDELQMFGKVKTAFHKMNLKVFNNEITPAVVPLDESVGTSASVSTNNYSVRCPCLVCPSSKDYVQCISCNTAQHPACFGLTRDDIEAIKSHVCDECALKNPQLDCTDPKLVLMDKKNKKNLCISRRVLLWCLGVLYLSEERLKETFQISISRTRMLMKHLESKEVFYPLPPGEENTSLTERKVHKHALRMIIPEYFPRKERNDMLDLSKLLLEEINVTPQDYTEMNELLRMPNTLTLGKVTNKPAVKRSEDDVSMFREVLTGDVDDEEDQMPLSGPHNPVQEKEAGKGKARGAKRKAEVPPATYRTRRSKQTAK